MRATSERAQAEALNRIAEARAQGPSAMDALHDLGEAVFGSLNDPACDAITKVHVETLPEALRRPELLATLASELNTWRSSMTTLLEDASRAGQLPLQVDPEGLTVLLMCTWEGLRIHHLIDPEHFRPELVLLALGALLGAKDADD